ncbi:MAG: hypothetical protein GY847_02525 [Proteobacteria bacterium]|nr:hypothetical protein [Pseudomonadota bacterium]
MRRAKYTVFIALWVAMSFAMLPGCRGTSSIQDQDADTATDIDTSTEAKTDAGTSMDGDSDTDTDSTVDTATDNETDPDPSEAPVCQTIESAIPDNNPYLASEMYFYDVWAHSSQEVFVVGDKPVGPEMVGVIAHYDGEEWKVSVDGPRYHHVWGSSPEDVYVLSQKVIHHFDGSAWSEVHSADELFDINGSSSNDIYVVGRSGDDSVVFHYDGSSWSTSYKHTNLLEHVSVTSEGDVFVAGPDSFLHYDGSQWRDMRINVASWMRDEDYEITAINSLVAFSSTEAYATCEMSYSGRYDRIKYEYGTFRFDGEHWHQIRTGREKSEVWGTSGENLFHIHQNIVFHFDGTSETTWELWYLTHSLYAVFGTSTEDVYAVGSHKGGDGLVFHYDGNSWEQLISRLDLHTLYDVWSEQDGPAIAVGGAGQIVEIDSNGWYSTESNTTENLLAIDGNGNNVFVVGESGVVLQLEGDKWINLDTEVSASFNDVWVSTTGDAFMIGDGPILLFDGSSFIQFGNPTGNPLQVVHGLSSNDVYAAGEAGEILHYDGMTWNQMPSEIDEKLIFLGGETAAEMFAVTVYGTVLKLANSNWEVVEDNSSVIQNCCADEMCPLMTVMGKSSDDIYAWQSTGCDDCSHLLLHFDGNDWRTVRWNGYHSTDWAYWMGMSQNSDSGIYVVGDDCDLGEGKIHIIDCNLR